MSTLLLAGSLTAAQFDDACETHFGITEEATEDLVVDLRECSYIHLAALFSILALLVVRNEREIVTLLRLPKERSVRDFMRLTKFPASISRITKKHFVEFVHHEDHKFFHGRGGDDGEESYSDALPVSQLRIPFFEWFPPTLKAEQDKELELSEYYYGTIDEQDEFWNKGSVSTVLRNLFRDPSYVVSHIVYEALTNAFRHPNSSVIAFASDIIVPKNSQHYLDPNHKSAPGTFTLCYWDDGDSIYETLGSSRQKKLKVETDRFLKVKLNCRNSNEPTEKAFEISNLRSITLESELEIFAASFLPGTTRDKSGLGLKSHRMNEIFDHEATRPGRGLYNLIVAACLILDKDRQKAKVSVRSGRYSGRVTASEENQKKNMRVQSFDLDVNIFEKSSAYYRGNLVIATLPINVPKFLLKAPREFAHLASRS